MTSNLEKKGSPSLATREVGVKALRYHTSSQNSNEPKVKTHTSGRMWFITDGGKARVATSENSMAAPQALRNLLLNVYIERKCYHPQRNTSTFVSQDTEQIRASRGMSG